MRRDDEIDRKKGPLGRIQQKKTNTKNKQFQNFAKKSMESKLRAKENEGIRRTTVKYRGERRARNGRIHGGVFLSANQ